VDSKSLILGADKDGRYDIPNTVSKGQSMGLYDTKRFNRPT
jgi:hypothetical protein